MDKSMAFNLTPAGVRMLRKAVHTHVCLAPFGEEGAAEWDVLATALVEDFPEVPTLAEEFVKDADAMAYNAPYRGEDTGNAMAGECEVLFCDGSVVSLIDASGHGWRVGDLDAYREHMRAQDAYTDAAREVPAGWRVVEGGGWSSESGV